MRPAASQSLAAAAALLLLGSPLPAYLVRKTEGGTDIRWNLESSAPNVVAGKVTYFVDEASAQDVSGAQFGAAVRSAILSWEDPATSSIAFLEDPGRAAHRKSGSDRVNRLGYSSGVLPPFAFAATFSTIHQGRITDSDIVFNPEMTWSVQNPGNPSKADVESVAAHEWGHAIGLDHVPLVRSTMYYSAGFGQLSLRSLETDDHAGAARSYPADGLDATTGRIRGRVSVAGTADDRGIQVVAVDFVTGFPVASSMTDPEGDYEILGLPPGVYRVLASPMGSAKVAVGVYSPWWDSAATGILPAVRGQGGAADGSTGAHVLAAGEVLEGIDLTVAAASAPGEPDGTIATARPSALGRSLAARIETNNDSDIVSFAGIAGRTVSIFVHARQIGSDLNPRLYLRAANGTVLAFDDDIAEAEFEVSGADTDSRILDFVLPSTATYYVEVEPAEAVDPSRPQDFHYVLTLLQGNTGAASPYTSGISATPAVVPADGISTTTVTFRPLTLQATPMGPGMVVTFETAADGDPDGTPGPPVNHGDGTWSVEVTAPAAPGGDVVTALVGGVPVSSVAVDWRGPADAGTSAFTASPRRIRSDGVATGVLALVPRDARSVPLGPGHAVVFSLGGSPAAEVGAAVDAGDGSYAASLQSGGIGEDLAVSAVVDGAGPVGAWTAAVGFPLDPVGAEAVADLDAALAADPAPPAKAAARLEEARAILAAAAGLDPLPASTAIRRALRSLDAARKAGADTAAVASPLAEAVREAALTAAAEALFAADTPAEIVLLDRALALSAKGDERIAAGAFAAGAAKHLAALRLALRVQ